MTDEEYEEKKKKETERRERIKETFSGGDSKRVITFEEEDIGRIEHQPKEKEEIKPNEKLFKIFIDKIILGLSEKVMIVFPSNSIDLIATDPPYGIGFMGKDWDKALPPKVCFKEMFRVLKHGCFALVMSSPRQDVLYRMMKMLEEVGFDIGFSSIYWTYATGFPKASNISKAIDKKACKQMLTKELGRKPTKEEFKEAWKDFRKKICENPSSRPNPNHDDLFGVKPAEVYYITESRTEKARELEGSYGGMQLKPAVEVIIVAMKPLTEKGYLAQAIKDGKGVTWLGSKNFYNIIDYEEILKLRRAIRGEE